MLFSGLPKCMTKAAYYRFNQAGLTEYKTLLEELYKPLDLPIVSIIFEILRERFSQKEFDRITEFSCPEMKWDSPGFCTDYLRTEIPMFKDILGKSFQSITFILLSSKKTFLNFCFLKFSKRTYW